MSLFLEAHHEALIPNALALAVIASGAAMLSTPKQAHAANSLACCTLTNGGSCCGGKCINNGTACAAQ